MLPCQYVLAVGRVGFAWQGGITQPSLVGAKVYPLKSHPLIKPTHIFYDLGVIFTGGTNDKLRGLFDARVLHPFAG